MPSPSRVPISTMSRPVKRAESHEWMFCGERIGLASRGRTSCVQLMPRTASDAANIICRHTRASPRTLRYQRRVRGLARVCLQIMLAASLAVLGINCTQLVRPRDASPIRSPQNIHSWLSARFTGLDIVEIGTRDGDGMACFAQTARAAVAVEIEKRYCEILRRRAARLVRRGTGNFSVVCQDYRTARLDGDVFTWWEQAPFLTNHVAIQHLRRELQAGRIRKSAQAVVLFDMSWQDDVDSLKQLITQAAWSKNVFYDEEALCRRKQEQARAAGKRRKDSSESCQRAKGRFVVAGIPLARLPRLRARRWENKP
eukprot:Transcript_20298.p1 GENE.Transcript_20298~~Transcript_20298.p1  ORF type:complete len:313 (-),score=79.32 Transcript_20298:968-1906(-)